MNNMFRVVDYISTKLSISNGAPLGHFIMLVDLVFNLNSDIVKETKYVRSHM